MSAMRSRRYAWMKLTPRSRIDPIERQPAAPSAHQASIEVAIGHRRRIVKAGWSRTVKLAAETAMCQRRISFRRGAASSVPLAAKEPSGADEAAGLVGRLARCSRASRPPDEDGAQEQQ